MNVLDQLYVEPLLPLLVVLGKEALLIALLSLKVALNVTDWVWADDLSSIVLSLTEKLLIEGAWSSVLVTIISMVEVDELEWLSIAVSVNVSVVLPKL